MSYTVNVVVMSVITFNITFKIYNFLLFFCLVLKVPELRERKKIGGDQERQTFTVNGIENILWTLYHSVNIVYLSIFYESTHAYILYIHNEHNLHKIQTKYGKKNVKYVYFDIRLLA